MSDVGLPEVVGRIGFRTSALASMPGTYGYGVDEAQARSTLVGVSRPERVAETIAWAEHDIPDAVWAALSEDRLRDGGSRGDPRVQAALMPSRNQAS